MKAPWEPNPLGYEWKLQWRIGPTECYHRLCRCSVCEEQIRRENGIDPLKLFVSYLSRKL